MSENNIICGFQQTVATSQSKVILNGCSEAHRAHNNEIEKRAKRL